MLYLFRQLTLGECLYRSDQGDFPSPSSYQPIIDYLGKVLVQVDDGDYQGDTRLVFSNNNQYGLVVIGWGSCSGCDALQSCTSYDEVNRLIDGIQNDIKWFDSLDEVKKHVSDEEAREVEFSYHSDEWLKFKNEVLEL